MNECYNNDNNEANFKCICCGNWFCDDCESAHNNRLCKFCNELIEEGEIEI